MDPQLLSVALVYVCLVFSFTVHEAAHAVTATALGDDTPESEGRVTLNPIAHLDPVGSVILPLIMLATSGFCIGWARPVNINPSNFKNIKRDDALTTLAGPGSNLAIAVLCVIAGRILTAFYETPAEIGLPLVLLEIMLLLNVILMIFNMLPLPPLDGHHLLPDRIKESLRAMGPLPLLIAMVVMWRYGANAIDPLFGFARRLMLGA